MDNETEVNGVIAVDDVICCSQCNRPLYVQRIEWSRHLVAVQGKHEGSVLGCVRVMLHAPPRTRRQYSSKPSYSASYSS